VPDLRAVEDGAFQDFDRRAVLLEVLRREIVEMDLDDGHEARQGLGYLLGRPQGPLDRFIHAFIHAGSLPNEPEGLKWPMESPPAGAGGEGSLADTGPRLLAPPPPRALPTDLDRV
jgi:hypothetical protein